VVLSVVWAWFSLLMVELGEFGLDWVDLADVGDEVAKICFCNYCISSSSITSKYFLLHLLSILHLKSKPSSTIQPTYLPIEDFMHNGSGDPAVSRKWGEFAERVP